MGRQLRRSLMRRVVIHRIKCIIHNMKTTTRAARIHKRTLSEHVYEHVKDGIVSNEYPPGANLSIGAVSQETGVSTTPIREALSRLVAEGLVEHDPNKGVRVAGTTPADVAEIYEVRLLIEPYLARLAARRVPGDSALRRELAELERAAKQVDSWTEKDGLTSSRRRLYSQIDLRLGDLLGRVSGNCLLEKMMATVSSHSGRVHFLAEASLRNSFELTQKANSEHLSIITAIGEGRSENVEALVCEHLSHAKERILEYMALGGASSIDSIRP